MVSRFAFCFHAIMMARAERVMTTIVESVIISLVKTVSFCQ
jgi:hypothetical protein